MNTKAKTKKDPKEFFSKMSDEDLKKFVVTSVTEDICNGDDLLDAAVDECKKRGIDAFEDVKQKEKEQK